MFEDILKADKDKWPCYAVFNDDKMMVLDYDVIQKINFTVDRKNLTDTGRIDTYKWVCVSAKTDDVSVDSTLLLRQLLNV